MIYTIGKTEIYESLFVQNPDGFAKKNGGSVWKTKVDAEAFIDNNLPVTSGFSVYGVEATWENDVVNLHENRETEFGSLTRDAKCVKIE